MNEHKLDEHLKNGKQQGERFFGYVQPGSLRKDVLHKISHAGSVPVRRKKPLGILLGAVAVCALTIVMVCAGFFPERIVPDDSWSTAAPREEQAPVESVLSSDTALEEQFISLGNGDDANYRASFYPVDLADKGETGMMLLLWQETGDAETEMIFSSILAQSDRVYPVSVVGVPGTANKKILLISSGSSEQEYLHYRLVGYDSGMFHPILTQDYVPKGKLGVQDGVIVEQRQDVQAQAPGTQASYIIPYEVGDSGAVYAPLESLHVHVGDHIIFIGSQKEALLVSSGDELLEAAEEEHTLPGGAVRFVAQKVGEGQLKLSLSGDGEGSTISLFVSE